MRVGSRIRAGCLALLVGAIVTPWAAPPCKAASGPEIEAEVQATLGEFFHKVGSAHECANRAVAILVASFAVCSITSWNSRGVEEMATTEPLSERGL
jgi:hypothetical protein